MNWDGVLQAALAQGAIALSVFSLITYLWLGATVLLMGDRRSLVTWVGALGLLSGALFFLSHGALVGAGVSESGSTDFWWRVSWLPAFAAPLFWAAIGLHYAGLAGAWRRLRLPALLAVGALGAFAALLALISWPFIAHYDDFIRLLDSSLRPQVTPQLNSVSPAVPLLGLAFVTYIAACACLPWASLVVRRLLIEPLERARGIAGEPGEMAELDGESALLWDARDAWSRARPALLAASLFIMGAGAVVAVIGVLVAISQHRALLLPFVDHLPQPLPIPQTQPGHVPLLLVVADLCVQVALVVVGLMVGWAVVRQGVLVERRLPQRGFTSYWRGMAGLAALFAGVVTWMAVLQQAALPDLLLLVALVALTCALLTWQSYVAHDRLLWQIRPFVASMSVGHTGWLATDPQEVERSVMALFTSLCRDVLGAAHGRLTVSAGRFSRSFTWQSPLREAVEAGDAREWTLPVSDERGVVARLALGPRVDGAGYTSADLEIARACGQRILDAVGEFVAAQAVAQLARRRGLEAELSAALPRRALHDEILPRLHLAMLQLERLRARLKTAQPAGRPAKAAVAVPSGHAHEEAVETQAPASLDSGAESDAMGDNLGDDIGAGLGAVVSELGKTHQDLARLMRAAPMASPRRMEHGFTGALRGSLDGEFRGVFDTLAWDAPSEASAAADALPAIVADLLLSAALEAVRNAGRHARGDDLRRKLALQVSLDADSRWVTVKVADDGVGLRPVEPESSPTAQAQASDSELGSKQGDTPTGEPGTRSGLLTHAALVGLIGGALTVHSEPGHGATVAIRVPRSGE